MTNNAFHHNVNASLTDYPPYLPIFKENKFAIPSDVATLLLEYCHEGRNLSTQETMLIQGRLARMTPT